MKKKIALALATLLAVGVVVTTASATGPIATAEGFPCAIFDGNGNLVAADTSHETWFASGKVELRCRGDVDNPTGMRLEFNFANTGLLCGTNFGGATANWRNTVGYNGSSQLLCISHADPSAASVSASSAGVIG
jgi:hypothetical protein